MNEMRKRFDEIVEYCRNEKHWVECVYCPCYKECQNLPEGDYSCEDMFFHYMTMGKNFDLKLDKSTGK